MRDVTDFKRLIGTYERWYADSIEGMIEMLRIILQKQFTPWNRRL